MIDTTKWAKFTAAVTAALALSAAPAFAQEEAADEEGPKIGEPAPQFELTDLDGETHSLSDYAGQIVVLHWQGIECPWEIDRYGPIISDIYRDFQSHQTEDGKQAVVFLDINSNHTESVEAVREYAEQWDIPYPVLNDEGNEVADLYGARTSPHIFIIDQEQFLRYKGHPETVPASFDDVGKGEEQYLVDAVNAILVGDEVKEPKTESKGCTIKRVESDE